MLVFIADYFLLVIPVSKMICQQINAIVKVEANHLANKYAREYKSRDMLKKFWRAENINDRG